MPHAPVASLVAQVPPVPIGKDAPIVQPDGSPGGVEHAGVGQATVVQGHRPFGEIVHGQVERPISGRIEGGRHPLLVLHLIPDQPVSSRAVGDDVGLGDDAGAHGEGRENQLVQNVAVEPAGYPVDQYAEEGVPGVAVAPGLAGRKVQRPRGGQASQLVLGVVLSKVDQRIGVFGHAGGMREQLPHRNAVPNALPLRQPLGDPVLGIQSPLLDQHRHRCPGELLPQRARLVDGAIGGRHPMLEVGESIATREQNPIATEDDD